MLSKLGSVNFELRLITKENGFYYIDNSETGTSCLNRSKLHLNVVSLSNSDENGSTHHLGEKYLTEGFLQSLQHFA